MPLLSSLLGSTFRGARGEVGPTPNITIGTIVTVDPTSTANVSTSGDASNIVLNFEIPRGNTGDAIDNVARTVANSALPTTGGTITGNLVLSGSNTLFVQEGTNFSTVRYVLTGTTTDAIEKEIFIGGEVDSRIPVSNNTTLFSDSIFTSRRTDSTPEHGSWKISSVTNNIDGTVSDVGNVYEIIVHTDDETFFVDARANNDNQTLNIYVTGAEGKTISWTAVVTTTEVKQ